MKLSELKELIKNSMLEVSPKSGATTLQEKDRVKLNLGLGAGNKYQYPNPREDEDIMPTDAMTPEELRYYEKMMGRGDAGKMTPGEEKMVSDYEEEEANKYALGKEEPMEEASVFLNRDEVYAKYAPLVKQYMKNGLDRLAAISKAEDVLAREYGATPLNIQSAISHYFDNQYNKATYGDKNPLEEASVFLNRDEVYAKYAPLVKQYMKNGLDRLAAISKAEDVLAREYGATPLNIQSAISHYFDNQYRNATYGDKNPLEENTFKKGDKVTYLGHPGEITGINKEMTGAITYNVAYDKGNGITKVTNLSNKGGEIKLAKVKKANRIVESWNYKKKSLLTEEAEVTPDIPEDIEWMWDGEVYDRVDYHNGDIGLEGYSKSTGRDYTASVMADYNGDDWDWSFSNIENIEVVPVKEIKNKPTHLRERKEPLSKLIRKADRIVEAWNSKKLIKEVDISQANFDDLTQVVENIAHINEVGMDEAAMQAIEFIAEQFDVPVDFKDFMQEISSGLFKSAINVSKERGTDRRTYKLGQTYFNQFIGKPLIDGKIIDIGVNKPQQGNYSDVSIEIEKEVYQNDGYHKGKDMIEKDFVFYDIDRDRFNLDSVEISRRDAVVLSKIAQYINPDTKYKETGKHFNIKGFR